MATSAPLPRSAHRFVETLVAHEELFSDRLLRFVPTDDLVNLCDALDGTGVGRRLLTNAALWKYVTVRDGLDGATTITPTVACRAGGPELNEYLSRRSQLEQFDASIFVLAGDLGTITDVNGLRVDCLAFPTSSSFRNPGIGVAGCVHRRIGVNVDRYVPNASERPDIREVLTTPGDGEIKLLVHCVGPSRFDRDRRVRLYNTYSKALLAIERAASVKCAAFASISTGTLQYPKQEAAEVAMTAVRDAFRTRRLPAEKRIAFVCIDKDMLKAFVAAHATVRRSFFTSGAAFPATIQEIPAP
jgi:O-acetyl-ADP-ribose deacetylase